MSGEAVYTQHGYTEIGDLSGTRRWAVLFTVLGGLSVLGALWMVFFYVPTESEMGVMQRINYIHVPAAWIGMFAFSIVALCSLGYLWLRDDRLDAIAISAAEAGFLFWTIMLIAGPIWAKVAWNTWWHWDARLSFALLLWLIWLGYFMLRESTENPEQGKRFAAILAIIGAVDLPLIHLSVQWFDTVHPKPVFLNPTGPTADAEITMTVLASLLAYTLLFLGLLFYRYALERLKRNAEYLRFAETLRTQQS